jgi:hypothetical protein
VPLVPRDFWLSARRAYESAEMDEISAILLAGLAVESSINEYASAWFRRKFGKDPTVTMKFLEDSIDFRRLVELLWFVGALSDSLKSDLHTVYNSRNKYAHIQVMKILGEKGEQEIQIRSGGTVVKTIKAKEDEVMRMILVNLNAEEEAWQILRKTELCIEALFDIDKSDYWRELVWAGAGAKGKSVTQP